MIRLIELHALSKDYRAVGNTILARECEREILCRLADERHREMRESTRRKYGNHIMPCQID